MENAPFDTLAAAQKLKEAGIEDAHAEAIVKTQAEAARVVLSEFMTRAVYRKETFGWITLVLTAIGLMLAFVD